MSESDGESRSIFEGTVASPFRSLVVRASGWQDDLALLRCIRRAKAHTGREVNFSQYGNPRESAASRSLSRFAWNVWWEPPCRWRDEYALEGAVPNVALVTEAHAAIFDAFRQTLYSNGPVPQRSSFVVEEPPIGIFELPTIDRRRKLMPLFGTEFPRSEWSVTPLRAIDQGGRQLQTMDAIRRAHAESEASDSHAGYWPGINQYECVLDESLGIMRRVTAVDEGHAIASIELIEISVDIPLPAGVFDLEPAPGSRYVKIVWSG